MIKTLIADDEQHALDRLKDLISDYDQFKIIAESRDGTSALEKIVSEHPDVAFLDINMPGVSVFKTLSSLSDPPLIIFQTAHSKYAADAFEIDALDYLLKPVSKERFARAVEKIKERLQSKQKQPVSTSPGAEQIEKISLKIQGAIKIIPVKDIQKICFEEGLSFIYTKEGRFLSDRSLNHYESKLQEAGFFRSNRANLINLNYIATIHKAFKGNYLVELKDGSRVELSRRKAQVLKKQLEF
ncbi:MAG: LytTR family transcriptional regulator DNA-binding domain-containing protein [Proteobacteria bacterium]|nr:LytTR family transcriptional regulator DNA-binding domain-containing protein [Pseudomonadota bacterium]